MFKYNKISEFVEGGSRKFALAHRHIKGFASSAACYGYIMNEWDRPHETKTFFTAKDTTPSFKSRDNLQNVKIFSI